jgi:hypothetical protein
MALIDARTVLAAVPCGDGRMMAELSGCLVMSGNRFAALTTPSECSHVGLVRNMIAASFMDSNFEWLLCIDSDIVPKPTDFNLLLEPCDLTTQYLDPEDEPGDAAPNAPSQAARPPRPSRVMCSLVVQPSKGKALKFDHRVKGAADMLVVAEYAYKRDTCDPVKLGMGFVRIHRSVFETLQALEHPKNPLAAEYDRALAGLEKIFTREYDGALEHAEILDVLKRSRPDPGGGARLWSGTRDGRVLWDYFPSGPMISQYVPTAQWKGEDHGFFTLCHLAGIIPRIETRTRLTHIGRKGYVYEGPDSGGGQ